MHTGASVSLARRDAELSHRPLRVQIDPGQLTFCGSVSYTACMRDPSPTAYDSRILKVRE